jgi:hypothetical protein
MVWRLGWEPIDIDRDHRDHQSGRDPERSQFVVNLY